MEPVTTYPTKRIQTSHFTLLEIILVVGALGMFLFLCSNTIILTLQSKDLIEENYRNKRVKAIGWNIVYQDLANVVGVHYLEGTVPVITEAQKKKDKKDDKKEKKKDEEKKSTSVASQSKLLRFKAEPAIEDPFLEIVVSRGRLRKKKDEPGLGFRLVKYFFIDHPDGEGQLLMRTEEPWEDESLKKNKETSNFNFEEPPDFNSEYRRYTVLEDYAEFEVSVYNGSKWVFIWDSTQRGDLPLALKISYQLINPDYNTSGERIEKIIPIPLSYITVSKPEEEL